MNGGNFRKNYQTYCLINFLFVQQIFMINQLDVTWLLDRNYEKTQFQINKFLIDYILLYEFLTISLSTVKKLIEWMVYCLK